MIVLVCHLTRSSVLPIRSSSDDTTQNITNVGSSAPLDESWRTFQGSHGFHPLTAQAAISPAALRYNSAWLM